MQGPSTTPTEDDEAFIPTEHARNSSNLNRTFTVRRKPTKRTFPWDLSSEEIKLAPPPQDEYTRDTKRPRLEEPFPTSTDEATTQNTSHDTTVAFPTYPDADVYAAYLADSDPVMDVQPNARATGALNCWTLEEDTKLTNAVANTRKQERGKKSYNHWEAIATLLEGRTKVQCCGRWNDHLLCKMDPTTARAGHWTADEYKMLKDAVLAHGAKSWKKVATLVPGRTKKQCRNRWYETQPCNIDPATARTGKWLADEDKKLKYVVTMHDGKSWEKVAAMIPGRTLVQCRNRWRHAVDPSVGRATARKGGWTTEEDNNLKDSVKMHDGKNWNAIARLVPRRTISQCRDRWRHAFDPRTMYQHVSPV
jgi:hypothetical protein